MEMARIGGKGEGFSRLVERFPRKMVLTRGLMLWVLVVTLYFLWEAATYSGLYAWLSEVQFDRFGQYLPILTFALLVLLFASPAAWLLRRSPRGAARGSIAGKPAESARAAAIASSVNFRRILLGFAGGLGAAAIICLLWTLALPGMAQPTRLIAVEQPAPRPLTQGPAFVRGEILYSRTSAFTQNLFSRYRSVRFAPMVPLGSEEGAIRFFVELPPTVPGAQLPTDAVTTRPGILMRDSLPGSIVRLYRYAGYKVERPYYVLYSSTLTMRWPYYVAAGQLAAAALLTLIAALIQHRHVRALTKPDADEAP